MEPKRVGIEEEDEEAVTFMILNISIGMSNQADWTYVDRQISKTPQEEPQNV